MQDNVDDFINFNLITLVYHTGRFSTNGAYLLTVQLTIFSVIVRSSLRQGMSVLAFSSRKFNSNE